MLYIRLAICLGAVTGLAQAATPPAKTEKHYTGIVTYVDAKEHTLGTAGTFFDKEFNLSPVCTYILPDHGKGTVSHLQPGANVTVSYQDVAGVLVANRVEEHPMRFAGKVDDVNSTNHTITVYFQELDRTFSIARNCQFLLLNDKPGAFTNIQNNSHVVVTYITPNQNPTALKVQQTSILFTGSLKAIDLSTGILKAKERFHLIKFQAAKNCEVIINGKHAQLSDLKPDDRLLFSYDVVKGVNLVNRIIPMADETNTVLTDEFKVDF